MKFSTTATEDSNQPSPEPKSNVLKPGIYPFSVLDAKEEVSRAGNDMIHLKLGVERPNGTDQWVHDYIVATQPAKLKAFCAAVGLLADFERGEIDAHSIIGQSGKVKVRVEPAKGNYPEKNAVAEYVELPADEKPAKTTTPAADEEIPF